MIYWLTISLLLLVIVVLLSEIRENNKLIRELKEANEEDNRVRYVKIEFKHPICLRTSQL